MSVCLYYLKRMLCFHSLTALPRRADIESISIFTAQRDAAQCDRAMRHYIVNPSLPRMIHCSMLHRPASLRKKRHLNGREWEEEARRSED
jgi:hypothetical protein